MRTHRAPLLPLACCLCALAASGEGKLEAALDANGVTALKWAGVELLLDGKPRVVHATFEDTGINEKGEKSWKFEKIDKEDAKVSFDAQKKSLSFAFSWGGVDLAYAPQPDRLGLAVTIRNDSKKMLADFDVALLRIKFPHGPKELKGGAAMRASLDNIAVVEAQFGTDVKPGAQGPMFGVTSISEKALFCCETLAPPVMFGLDKSSDWGREYTVTLRGGVNTFEPGGYEIPPHGLPRIPPGKSQTFDLSVRFAPAATPNAALLSDLYTKFRAHHQPVLEWKDHRPIGALHLHTGKGPKENPRKWFDLKDATSDAGKAELKKKLIEYADRSVKTLKEMDAQGALVWNIEGEENPHPISYIGDPRLIKTLAPEMDEIADELFKRLKDAGLRTGCCLRPSQVYFNEQKKQWDHGTGSDGGPGRGDHYSQLRPKDLPWWRFFPVVERLCDKIAYAKQRWGCTLFYVDTNGIFCPTGEDAKFQWLLLTSEMWKRIHEKHPDVLIIPELHEGDSFYHAAQWAYTATYLELDYGRFRMTPPYARDLFPQAFSAINMKDAKNLPALKDQLAQSVKRGDILLFRGWFMCSVNPKVQDVYKAAASSQP